MYIFIELNTYFIMICLHSIQVTDKMFYSMNVVFVKVFRQGLFDSRWRRSRVSGEEVDWAESHFRRLVLLLFCASSSGPKLHSFCFGC